MELIYVGIDWGSRVHAICVLDPDREKLLEQEVGHDGEAIRMFIDKLVELVDGDASRIVAGMEAPRGTMVEALLDRGAQVFSISPKQVDRFRDRYSPAGAKDDAGAAFSCTRSGTNDRCGAAFALAPGGRGGAPGFKPLRRLARAPALHAKPLHRTQQTQPPFTCLSNAS